MNRIFLFIYQYRSFFTFLLLELICVWFIIQYNSYQGARFFNSAGGFVAGVNSLSYGVRNYFMLRQVNEDISAENIRLRDVLERQNQLLHALELSSMTVPAIGGSNFDFIGARVIDNTVNQVTNHLIIDKGRVNEIAPGMAVLGPDGVVGKVRSVSEHFSVVTSLLHVDIMVSAAIKRTSHFGTIKWDGRDPLYVNLLYIPPHVTPLKGDTIVTSGFNAVFPPGAVIGTIDEVSLNESAPWYDLKVRLSQDFQKLAYVAVVKSTLKSELDSLRIESINP